MQTCLSVSDTVSVHVLFIFIIGEVRVAMLLGERFEVQAADWKSAVHAMFIRRLGERDVALVKF